MIEEYDVVEASKDLNGKVLKGCKGTVLIVYSDFPSSFEVEFIDNNFKTIDVSALLNWDRFYIFGIKKHGLSKMQKARTGKKRGYKRGAKVAGSTLQLKRNPMNILYR